MNQLKILTTDYLELTTAKRNTENNKGSQSMGIPQTVRQQSGPLSNNDIEQSEFLNVGVDQQEQELQDT